VEEEHGKEKKKPRNLDEIILSVNPDSSVNKKRIREDSDEKALNASIVNTPSKHPKADLVRNQLHTKL
jgi:hypothetical protein